MARFYTKVFQIRFKRKKTGGHHIYSGNFSGMDFVLVPAALTGVQPTENKVHFDIYVNNIKDVIKRIKGSGGSTNNNLVEDETVRCIGVFDPDKNFMAVKQQR